MNRDTLAAELARVRQRRLRVEEERRLIAYDLRDLVRTAASAGWAKTQIAQTAGISRQTVHEMLRD